jgi:hypothetical protein
VPNELPTNWGGGLMQDFVLFSKQYPVKTNVINVCAICLTAFTE